MVWRWRRDVGQEERKKFLEGFSPEGASSISTPSKAGYRLRWPALFFPDGRCKVKFKEEALRAYLTDLCYLGSTQAPPEIEELLEKALPILERIAEALERIGGGS